MRTLIAFAAVSGLIAGAASSAQAANWLLDFDELQRGEILGNQYASGIPGATSTSVTISALGGEGDVAVAFDTNNATTGSNNGVARNDGDPDLADPFDNTSTNFGNILVVQEDYFGATACGSFTCLDHGIIPDDELHGGSITFDFGDTPTDLTSIDYFDNENWSSQSISLEITYADSSMVSQQLTPVGNHDWGVFNFGNLGKNVTKLVAVFAGTGAIDRLRGRDRGTAVSEPQTLAIFLGGLAGLALYRRRRQKA